MTRASPKPRALYVCVVCGRRSYRHRSRSTKYCSRECAGVGFGPPEQRFAAKIVRAASGCLLWTGSKTRDGYGRFWMNGEWMSAHHAALLLAGRDLPHGKETDVDHLCRNRSCVEHLHLEVVTHKENMRRSPLHTQGIAASGKCMRGHDASESVRRRSNGRVVYCKACRREKRRAEADEAKALRPPLPDEREPRNISL